MRMWLSQASSACHTTGQYIGRWVVGTWNNDFNRKASRPRRWQTSISKNHLPSVPVRAHFIHKMGGAHCGANQSLSRTTVTGWQWLPNRLLLGGEAYCGANQRLSRAAVGSSCLPRALQYFQVQTVSKEDAYLRSINILLPQWKSWLLTQILIYTVL